jgi:hypothetical protein
MPKGKKYGGRQKGSLNKFTLSVKEAFKEAFDQMQKTPGVSLYDWGCANPGEFYKLASKLIPTQIAGVEGKPIEFRAVQDLEALPVQDLEAIEAILSKPKDQEKIEFIEPEQKELL